ncbi:MAG: hypothetical protein ACQERS_06685 [Bacteroidota bacterium]
MNKQIERIIYVVALVSGALSLFFEFNTVLSILLFLFSMVYLFLGWLLLNPERTKKFDFVYFFVGYFFSTSFIALLFNIRDYPLKELFLYASVGMLVFALVLIMALDRARKKPVIENTVKILLLLAVVVLAVIL